MNALTQSPEKVRVALFGGLINLHQHWRRLVNARVPDSYLDEVFHVPQAQAYWAGNWTHWDNKITTPPALYGFSYLFTLIRRFGDGDEPISAEDLRFVNVLLLYFFLVTLYIWTGVSRKSPNPDNVLQAEINIAMFPLFFFFSGLYYTDLFSALTVVLTYIAWSTSVRWQSNQWFYQLLHVICGLLSLASRQTNIFWVGVFLGGLQVIETVKSNTNAEELHDPEIGQSSIADIPKTCLSLVTSIIPIIPRLILDIWPSLTLLISFAAFVIWNDGVVLGDKSNHVATIHTPQMLYIWPFILFFSWPILLPHLSNPRHLLKKLPNLSTSVLIMAMMGLSVHFNTIVHPFTLADNRHYVFYVFRILTRKWWIKYAAVPVYYICGWLTITALSLNTPHSTPISPATPTPEDKLSTPPNPTTEGENESENESESESENESEEAEIEEQTQFSNPLSFTLVFLISTTLSLISAPLVEPRYFIIPWLIWRLHVPELAPSPPTTIAATSNPTSSNPAPVSDKSNPNSNTAPKHKLKPNTPATLLLRLHQTLSFLTNHALWIELFWYGLVNWVTCHVFLYRDFEWIQEPGKAQRFMW